MIIDDFVTPAALTAFVREVPTPSVLSLNQFLPDRTIGDIEAVIDEVTRTNRAAKFRAYDAETPIGQRDSFERRRVTLPPLGQKTVIGEYERLMLERIRSGGNSVDSIVETIYDDATLNAQAVLRRMELARGDVLTDGKFTLTGENGLTIEADWGVAADHLVTAAVLWSDAADAKPLTDLNTWVLKYTDDAGEPPAYAVASRTVIANMQKTAEVRQTASSLAGVPSIVSRAQLDQVLAAHNLPPIVEYNTRLDMDGSTVRPIPDDTVVFTPQDPSSLGYTAWGITAEALELAGGSAPTLTFGQVAGLVGVVLKEGDPVRTWTKVAAVGMPVIVDPRKLFVATVL